jgi:hypothetical protein
MTSERIQRQIDRLLDEAEEAAGDGEWQRLQELCERILTLSPGNPDAEAMIAAAQRGSSSPKSPVAAVSKPAEPSSQPTSFANGRYEVRRFLGEGGKKKVYLAHDAQLDRDIAFALIKTEGLDEAARTRVTREAQAMGRLGSHPHIVTVYDIGEENGQPYLVLPVLPGGDVEGVIEDAPDHKLSIEQAVKIATETCLGLEFSHSKGIIHRDLKPGNVWLAEDGRAMIGDFGLAVAVDRSRLTQAGMMVGTVNYMPPEQAMGGEVTPQSDLYSLGAMLYEMVCGRPPFVGDESVAIIGQHLNMPPVAPSWHRPDCPSALEALILRLLEKDPGKRSESATEVRKALQAIGQAGNSAGRTATINREAESPSAADPLYRRTFVGRENEVRQLQQAFDRAMSGNGALVMVVGEPGIGKTALCEQLATYVALRGGKALVGHCYEEGSLSLPYLAFVEAMRSHVLARDPEGLRSDLGTGAGDVARIVSEVRDRVQGVELRPAGDPEDDRWRLLQAVTSFLHNASTVQPLCIVLEDLHWADRGTLDLLLHVSRNLQGSRLLVIGTYRDVEVDRTHPLSATLAELRRGSNFLRVPLRGLTVDEVHRMYEAIRGNEVPWGQAEAVHRQTEGNPLFVQEILRYLVEEGLVVREGSQYIAQQGVANAIPDGLRDVIGRRLTHLGERTNQVLSIASVVGREFRLDVMQEVARLAEEELYSALEEASERAILEQTQTPLGVVFRFTHAMFRTLLYEEIFTPRRIRLHQQVGRALEGIYGRRLEEHAAELAEHFSQSTEASDLEKAVHYGELAAQRSMVVYAYGEAVRHLEQALRAQEVLDSEDDAKRCDLLIAVAKAQLPMGEPGKVSDQIAPRAYELASRLHDRQRIAAISRLALDAIQRASFLGGALRDGFQMWTDRMVENCEPSSAEAAFGKIAHFRIGQTGMGTSFSGPAAWRGKDSKELLAEAYVLARSIGERDMVYQAAWNLIFTNMTPSDWHRAVQLHEELWDEERSGVGSRNLALYLQFASVKLLDLDRATWEAAGDQLAALAERTQDANVRLSATGHKIQELLMEGSIEEAMSLAEAALLDSIERGIAFAPVASPLGQAAGYLGLDPSVHLNGDTPAGPMMTLMSLSVPPHSGTLSVEATKNAVKDLEKTGSVTGRISETGLNLQPIGAFLLGALRLGDRVRLQELLDWPGLPNQTAFILPAVIMSLARLCGSAAIALEDVARARHLTEKAIADCEAIRHRPELALSWLQLAELLLEHYPGERNAAIEHLDFAIAEFREMKMQPALERALRHRGLIKA